MRTRTWFCSVALMLVCVVPVDATVFKPTTLAESVAESERIVVARCEAAESVWIGRSLFTRYRFRVEETVRGAPSSEVEVLLRGGVDRNRPHPVATVVPGTPVFLRNQRAVLLLRSARVDVLPDAYTLTRMKDAAFVVEDDTVTASIQSRRAAPTRLQLFTDHLRSLSNGSAQPAPIRHIPLRSTPR